MNETTAVERTCVLCKEPIEDPVSQGIYDPVKKKIVYRHKDSYCQKKPMEFYLYMKRWGQTKHD